MDINQKEKNTQSLKDLVINEGISLFGIADITSIKNNFLLDKPLIERFNYGISLGYRLSSSILESIKDAPNQIYYFHYQRVNMFLDIISLKVTSWIQNKSYLALPIPASQVIDWQKNISIVSHREIARLAGHGWYGRNNLIVNPNFGSQVRYATILTDMPLITNKPLIGSCGSCKKCISVCPAKAIEEDKFNREACIKQLKEFTKTQKIGQMICGICVKICDGKR